MRRRTVPSSAAPIALIALACVLVAACASAAAPPTASPAASTTPKPTVQPNSDPAGDQARLATPMADAPLNSSARALAKPRRGTDVPEGAVIFGADYASSAKAVELVGQRTEFEAGSEVAWRVALPAARGGESVRVTLTTEDGTETQVDNFVAMAGWNVYFGKSMLTVEPGTYVLHYLYDGHEVGSGTFTLS